MTKILCKHLDAYLCEDHLQQFKMLMHNRKVVQAIGYELASTVKDPPLLYMDKKTSYILIWLN